MSGGATSPVVPAIPAEELATLIPPRPKRILNARLDPSYRQPISHIGLYKLWLSRRRREAFASSPLSGRLIHVPTPPAPAAAAADVNPSATGGGGGGGSGSGGYSHTRAVVGALPSHSAVLGSVRRVNIKRIEHVTPFVPSNAAQAKRAIDRYGPTTTDDAHRLPSDGYDDPHRHTLEHMLSSRAKQSHPQQFDDGGSSTSNPNPKPPRPPFYPSHPSEAKRKIENNVFMYSGDESARRRAAIAVRERAVVNAQLFRSRFVADSEFGFGSIDAGAGADPNSDDRSDTKSDGGGMDAVDAAADGAGGAGGGGGGSMV